MLSLRQRFGKRIRQLRLERRQTQEEFWGDFLGLSVPFGSLIERGVNSPSFENIEVICKRLGISEAILFTFPSDLEQAGVPGRVKKTAAEKRQARRWFSKRKGR